MPPYRSCAGWRSGSVMPVVSHGCRAMARWLLMAVVITQMGGLSASAAGMDASAPDAPVAGSGSPQVALQDDRLAVIAPHLLAERVGMIADTGTSLTRIEVFWRDIAPTRPADATDPTDPAYDFSRYDTILTGLAQRGVSALLVVYNTPSWASGGIFREGLSSVVNAQAPDASAFGEFMQALAIRYSGRFHNGSERLPAVGLFEVWNEGNLEGFLFPQTRGSRRVVLDSYAQMVRAAYVAIKGVNPSATVIAGAGAPIGRSARHRTGVEDWIDGLAEREVPMDAYSQHVYPEAGPLEPTRAFPAWATLGRLERAVDRIRPGLPIYITEAGYTTAHTRFRHPRATKSLDQQARYLRQVYQLRTSRIRAIVWFNLQDNQGWPGGLLDVNRNPKPSYNAFLDAARDVGITSTRHRRPACAGRTATIIGTRGDDVLRGTARADVIVARDGDDTVLGGGGHDLICLGNGNDRAEGGDGSDEVFGQSGQDELRGGSGPDLLWGGSGRDRLWGGPGRDRLGGGPGRDWLSGGSGPDALTGRAGRDWLVGGRGDDRLEGGPGRDVLTAQAGRDRLEGGDGGDLLLGGPGGDRLEGGPGRDVLTGQAGDDHLMGGLGPDRLDGGSGSDLLAGEAGRDRLMGGRGTDRLDGGPGRDVLSGDAGNDRLMGGRDSDRILGRGGRDRLGGQGGHDVLIGGGGQDIAIGGPGKDRCRAETTRGC